MKPANMLLKGFGVFTILALTGCGFKGPLVPPEEATDNQSIQQPSEPESQNSRQGEEQ